MGTVTLDLDFSKVNPKQKLALEDTHKYIGYGGARGGGKSWFVKRKAILLAGNYAGIHSLIVRQSYPELMNNHIREMRSILHGVAKYVDKEKIFIFRMVARFSLCIASVIRTSTDFRVQSMTLYLLMRQPT